MLPYYLPLILQVFEVEEVIVLSTHGTCDVACLPAWL